MQSMVPEVNIKSMLLLRGKDCRACQYIRRGRVPEVLMSDHLCTLHIFKLR